MRGTWRQLVCCAVTPQRVVQSSCDDSLQQISTGRVQQCDGDGDDNNVMESKSTDHLALPPQYDISDCSHTTAITSPVHCCLQHPFPFTQ